MWGIEYTDRIDAEGAGQLAACQWRVLAAVGVPAEEVW